MSGFPTNQELVEQPSLGVPATIAISRIPPSLASGSECPSERPSKVPAGEWI